MAKVNKTYNDLKQIDTFEDRYEYLKLEGRIGYDTFGHDRYLNQAFYKSKEWRTVRDRVIARDNGCDLGIPGREIHGKILVHHINPISVDDFDDDPDILLNEQNLITVSETTHNAIHYGSFQTATSKDIVERKSGDTCPWKNRGEQQ